MREWRSINEQNGRVSRRDFYRCHPAARPGGIYSSRLYRDPRRNRIAHRRPVRDDPGNRPAMASCPGFHGEVRGQQANQGL